MIKDVVDGDRAEEMVLLVDHRSADQVVCGGDALLRRIPVSYTHLTLPTTPYV